VYVGNWKEDKQDGYGSYTFSNGDKYAGNYINHKRSGFGTYNFSNGAKYIGEWANNQFEGQGTYYYADGTIKSGIWSKDEYVGPSTDNHADEGKTGCVSGNCSDGYGKYIWSSGEKYEGYWRSDKRNGQGTNYYASGAKATGEWKDDKLHGLATFTYKSSSNFDKYIGNYYENHLEGKGTLHYKNKDRYEGFFKNDLFNGEGTYYYADGTIKSGVWKDDEYIGKSENNLGCISGDCNNGYGTYIFEGGEKYIGSWVQGTYNGQGTFYLSNGDKYIGEFDNGTYEGQGTYIFASDGRKYVGHWNKGKFNGSGTMYYANGTIKSGEWKDNDYLGESKITGKVPEISWLTPESLSSQSNLPNTFIKACIKSKGELNNYQVIVNGIIQYSESATKGYTVVSDACDFVIEKDISLSKGENQVKIVAKNNAGSSTSDIRTIVYGGAMQKESRYALIIGNAAYSVGPLRNPVNDAKSIANELRNLGFEVDLYTDQSRDDMVKSIRDFGQKLVTKKGIGLFYYSGHGIQMNGENYLVPVSAQIQKEQDVELEAVNLKRIMGEMDYAGNQMNIVILDACRNNPFARSFRSSASNGLAMTTAPQGTFIAYATAPGSVASDGSGNNGLYTEELISALRIPNLKIEDVFKHVRNSVYDRSAKQQVPWENSSIFGDFYFKK
jgi:hypothetical protein